MLAGIFFYGGFGAVGYRYLNTKKAAPSLRCLSLTLINKILAAITTETVDGILLPLNRVAKKMVKPTAVNRHLLGFFREMMSKSAVIVRKTHIAAHLKTPIFAIR